ncbi:unnamed protein product [Heterobilharzia americana]|nr:unnamed protein product [Heterobilharzia americana]
MSPQRRSITETLCRLIRFSYYENVKRLLPKSFYILLPPQPTVINKYEKNPELPSARAFLRLVDSMRSRLEPQNILRIAENAAHCNSRRRSISEPFDDDGSRTEEKDDDEDESSDNSESQHSDEERRGRSPIDTIPLSDPEFDDLDDSESGKQAMRARLKARRRMLREMTELSPGVTNLSIELFFSALLIAGHKTISHTFAFIKKYAGVIRTLTSTVETQVEALHVIQAVWANNPQMIVIITEHMCRVGLIDPEAVVRWAYSPIMTSLTDNTINLNSASARPKILDFYVWECLSRTLIRVGRRVARITGRLELAKENVEVERRRSPYSTPDRDETDQGEHPGGFVRNGGDDSSFFKKPKDSISGRLRRNDNRKLIAGWSTLDHSLASESSFFLHETIQPTSLSEQALRNIMFWLKGRLVQVVLEHCDQLIPYLDNLDEFICGAHPEVQDVFQQLRSLYA